MDVLKRVKEVFNDRELVEACAYVKSIDDSVESIKDMVEMAFEVCERDEEEMFLVIENWKQQYEEEE